MGNYVNSKWDMFQSFNLPRLTSFENGEDNEYNVPLCFYLVAGYFAHGCVDGDLRQCSFKSHLRLV